MPIDSPFPWRAVKRTVNAKGEITSTTETLAGRDPKDAPPVGVPLATSTLFDKEGRVSAQWVKTGPEHLDPKHVAKVLLDEIARPMERAPIIFNIGGGPHVDDLMTVIPIGDLHMGMLAWAPETGANWDIKIAENTLTEAFRRLLPRTPKCSKGVVLNLGDFSHYDSPEPMTPRGRHLLDAAGRWQKMVRAGLRVKKRVIEMAAAWYGELRVVELPGNHDPFQSTVVSEAFALHYEDNPRITVDTSASPYRYLKFGNCLLGMTHGDLCKPEALGEIMAADRPEDWGMTTFRMWLTGHIHSHNGRDLRRVTWESFRTLAPADAWAHRMGYRSLRDLHALTFSRHGLYERVLVNPDMMGEP